MTAAKALDKLVEAFINRAHGYANPFIPGTEAISKFRQDARKILRKIDGKEE